MHRKSGSEVSVPFSWEYRAGVSKLTRKGSGHMDHEYEMGHFTFQLPPPPPPYSSQTSAKFVEDIDHNKKQAKLSVRLSFQPLSISLGNSLKLGCTVIRKEDDPFLAAYLKCTQSPFVANFPGRGSTTGVKKKTLFTLSCKHSCTVRQNDVVKMSRLPKYKCASSTY